MASKMSIEFLTVLPAVGLKPNSIYIIDPGAGNMPALHVTNKAGSTAYRVNPSPDLTPFIKKVNTLIPNASGEVALELSFAAGILKLTGQPGTGIDLSATYVTSTIFNNYKTLTDGRLDSLESAMTEGLRTPIAFNAATTSVWPTNPKGTTLKVTVAGTVSTVVLEIGDTVIYDTTGNTPFVVQSNVDAASVTVRGLIMIADAGKVTAGTDALSAVTPAGLQAKINTFLTAITASQIEVNAGTVTNKFVNPLTQKTYFDGRKASQAEVDTGENDTKFVTPLTLQVKLNALSAAAHSHSNKASLDKIGESVTGEMTFNGDAVYTLGSNAW